MNKNKEQISATHFCEHSCSIRCVSKSTAAMSRRAFAKPYPIRRCERSVSEENEAIFDCTGGVEQRKQKSNIENNTPLHAVQLRANGKAPRLPVRPYILKPACFHRTRRVTIQAVRVVRCRTSPPAHRRCACAHILLPPCFY